MAKEKGDNIGSCVQNRSHLTIDPAPMYVRNDLGHKAYKDLGLDFKTERQKSTLWVDDLSNKSGMRGRGGY